MNLHVMPPWSATLIRRGGLAGVLVTIAGLAADSPTVTAIGLLTLLMASYAAIWTGNRTW